MQELQGFVACPSQRVQFQAEQIRVVTDNLNRLKNVTETISNKIKNQEKLYLNTNYKKSKQDIENAKKLLEKAEVAYTIDDSEQANSIINNAIKNLKSAPLKNTLVKVK